MIDYFRQNKSLPTQEKIKECYNYYNHKNLDYDDLYSEYERINMINPRIEINDKNIFFKKDKLRVIQTKFMKSCLLESIRLFIENKSIYERYNTYLGGRISILISSESDDNIYLLSPIYGAEYYFNDNFSLGGETRLNYAFDKSDAENSVIDISAHLFFRFYK